MLESTYDKILDEEYQAEMAEDAEQEYIESLLESAIPCQHCFERGAGTEMEHGQYQIVCSECGAATGYTDTLEQAFDAWNGVSAVPVLGTRTDDAHALLQELHSEEYSDMTEDESDMAAWVLAKIWNNEVPGIRFECGGANNRVKK